MSGLADAFRDAPPAGRDLVVEVAGYLAEAPDGATAVEVARAIHARASVVRRLLAEDERFSGPLTVPGGRRVFRIASTAGSARDRQGQAVPGAPVDPAAFDAGQAAVLVWTLDHLTAVRERLSDVVQCAYLDGREDGKAENPPPPGITAAGCRVKVLDLFDPIVDELRSHASDVLERITTSADHGTITEKER
jgi:hypothetical protein